jgi:hypothetical protein
LFVAIRPAKNVELAGPVGIVREGARTGEGGFAAVLRFLALIGSYFWLAFPAMHVLDAATLPAFRRKYRLQRSDEAPVAQLETRRIARLRQLLHWLLVVSVPLLLASIVLELAGASAAPLKVPQIWLSPIFFPLTWLLAKSLWAPPRRRCG